MIRFSILSILLSLFLMLDGFAQNTLITLNDSTKVKTEITAISDNLLFSKAGSFNLSEIYSIRFESKEEYNKKKCLQTFCVPTQ